MRNGTGRGKRWSLEKTPCFGLLSSTCAECKGPNPRHV